MDQMEPHATSGFLIGKLATAIGGLIGGLSVATLWRPDKLRQSSHLVGGAVAGALSVGAAISLGGIICNKLGLAIQDIDNALGVGFTVGVSSVFILNALAKFFEKREQKDLVELADEAKKLYK